LTVEELRHAKLAKLINQSVSPITEKCKIYLRLPVRWDVWTEMSSDVIQV